MTIAPVPESEFKEAFAKHRPDLLRHAYRMMGSFADAEDVVQDVLLKAWRARERYVPEAPMVHWLMRIATTTCLKALEKRRPRGLPQLDQTPFLDAGPLEKMEPSTWVTPAPDAQIFPGPDQIAEARESVAIAFIALLQRLPPKQRAVILLKDVLGWPSEDIASTLEMTLSAVSSALHRARETVARRPSSSASEPAPDVIQRYRRSWEAHDLDSLVAFLKQDVVLAMPPFPTWLHGAEAVRRFFLSPRFEAYWSKGLLGTLTHANGISAVAWYVRATDGIYRKHSIEVVRFEGDKIAESTHFIGPDYSIGFDLPEERRA